MKIQTDYYGEVEYDQEDLIEIPNGFFGFPQLKFYLPLCISEDDGTLLLMQSVEKPEVAFVVIAPSTLCIDYSPLLSQEDLEFFDVAESSSLSYYAVCVIRNNYLEDTVNMKCPLVINPENRIARQVILENPEYQYQHKISSFKDLMITDNPQE